VVRRTIRDFMTPRPRQVAGSERLTEARRLMRAEHIRHLPVVEGERVVGILSQRDVFLMETLTEAEPAQATVEEAMRASPYLVDPEAPLEAVVLAMWRDKLGAALVVEEQRLVGIFTRTDALRALVELMAAPQEDWLEHGVH
jgi:acetoin utilization protein AcuB